MISVMNVQKKIITVFMDKVKYTKTKILLLKHVRHAINSQEIQTSIKFTKEIVMIAMIINKTK